MAVPVLTELGAPSPAPASLVIDLAWAGPAGDYLAVVNTTGTRLVVYTRTGDTLGSPLTIPTPPATPSYCDWSPDGLTLAVSVGGFVHAWTRSGTTLTYVGAVGGAQTVERLRFSPDGAYLASAHASTSGNKNVEIYTHAAGVLTSVDTQSIESGDEDFIGLAWTPNGGYIAAALRGSQDGVYLLKRVANVLSLVDSEVTSAAWSTEAGLVWTDDDTLVLAVPIGAATDKLRVFTRTGDTINAGTDNTGITSESVGGVAALRSQDGSVALVWNGALHLTELTGAETLTDTTPTYAVAAGAQKYVLRWTADGHYLALGENGGPPGFHWWTAIDYVDLDVEDVDAASDMAATLNIFDVSLDLGVNMDAASGMTAHLTVPQPERDAQPHVPPQRLVCELRPKIVNRGGTGLVDLPPFSRVSFSRRLDDTTACTVTIPAGEPFTAATWRHEIAIVDDMGVTRWAGPVTSVDDGDDEDSTIGGRDLTAWWDHRFIAQDRSYTEVDLAHVFAQVADDCMQQDPTPNVQALTEPCGITGDRSYTTERGDLAGDKLRELARTGVDYTAIGRQVLIGGAVTSDRVWKLTGPMCERVRRTGRGLSMANDVMVLGATETVGDETTTATGRSEDLASIAHLGLLQTRFDEGDILDDHSADANARTRRELIADDTGDLRVLLREGQYTFDALIPGTLVDVDIPQSRFPEQSQAPVQGLRRLFQVDVDFSPEGMSTVITLQPVGTTDTSGGRANGYVAASGPQTAAGVSEDAVFDIVIDDPGDLYDTATNSVTVDRTGPWVFEFDGTFALDPLDTITAAFAVNGVPVEDVGSYVNVNDTNVEFLQAVTHATPNNPAPPGTYTWVHRVLLVNEGDVVTVALTWNVGNALASGVLIFNDEASFVPPYQTTTVS